MFFDDINQLLPVPHVCVQSLKVIARCLAIVAVPQSTNYHHKCCIWQLWDGTNRFVAYLLSQIRRQSLVTTPSIVLRLPNLTWTLLQKQLHPLSPNPFGSIEIIQRQWDHKSIQKICGRRLPVQVSITQLFQTVLSRDNGPMVVHEEPSLPYFLPLVEHAKVGLLHSFGKLLQGEFCLLQADWDIAFGPTQVQQIIPLSVCFDFVIRDFC